MAAQSRNVVRFYYPRSFPKLLFVGLALIALPLMIAVLGNAVSIDQLANRSQKTVYQAVQATQSSRRLLELITAMERAAHQMLILGDRSLLEAYEFNRRQFFATADEFADLPFDREQMVSLGEIMRGESDVHALLASPSSTPGDLERAVQGFVSLADRAQAITARSNALIDSEVEAMRETARQAQQVTLWQLLALIPVVTFLIIGFMILIARPIRQIDAAIRQLGAADFSGKIAVTGPEDLQYLGERLEWLRTRLVDLEEQKNRFLRHMSHELKTPLTAVREGAELLSEEVVGRLAPEQREIAEIVRHNSIELQKLIEDLLSYGASRLQKGSLDLQTLELAHVVKRVVDDQKLAARAKDIRIAVSVQPITIEADAEKLRIMLDNLVSNAVKFSPPGGTVHIMGEGRDGWLNLDVADNGPGIGPEEREKVFEPFYRGRHAGDALVKGTGIGLSVVREYAQAHGGEARIVDRGDAAGARVRIILPLHPAHAEPVRVAA